MNGGLQQFAETGQDYGIMSGNGPINIGLEGTDDLVATLWFTDSGDKYRNLADAVSNAGLTVLRNGSLADTVIGSDGVRFTIEFKEVDHLPAMRFDAADAVFAGSSALRIVPALTGGGEGSAIAVTKAAVRAALALCDTRGCVAVGWQPADSAMSVSYFRKVAAHWLAGGPFPALGLTSLSPDADGAIVSRGLRPLIGQELRILPAAELPGADRARVAIRVIDHLVMHGPVIHAEQVEVDGYGLFELQPLGEIVNLEFLPIA